MYELYYTNEFKKDVKKLDGAMQKRARKVLEKILQDPTRFKHLEHGDNRFRVRFGVYRLLYKLDGNKIILVRLGKRDSVYR